MRPVRLQMNGFAAFRDEAVVDLDYHEPQTGYRRKFQRVLTGPVLAGDRASLGG